MNYTNEEMNANVEEQKNTGFRLAFLVGAAAILCVAIIVGVLVLITGNMNQQKYVAAVNEANDYYMSGDYNNAILQYQQAIAINDKEVSSYLNMSSAYMVMGDYESAKTVILQGLKRVESEELRNRLAELENGKGVQTEGTEPLTGDEILLLASGITMENTSFDMVAAYTYTEYYRDFGAPTSNTVGGGQLNLYYNSMNFNAFYYDLANERVLDN